MWSEQDVVLLAVSLKLSTVYWQEMKLPLKLYAASSSNTDMYYMQLI